MVMKKTSTPVDLQVDSNELDTISLDRKIRKELVSQYIKRGGGEGGLAWILDKTWLVTLFVAGVSKSRMLRLC